jgi:arsenate reductase
MVQENRKKRVLVLCTGNSCRSQMAEGWIRDRLGARWEVRSAGTRPMTAIHPLAVRAMAEAGIDISAGRPEHVDAYLDQPWDLVVTVCDSAKEVCPVFPRGAEKLHVSFFDPSLVEASEEERMLHFRRVRDEIRDRLLAAIQERG